LAYLEPDFVDLLTRNLQTLSIAPDLPEARARGWRGLYLSLGRAPRRLILVPSLDDHHAPGVLTQLLRAAHEIDDADATLLVIVDAIVAPTAERLPFGTAWRSLAEFEERLEHEDRVAILTALIHNVRPEAVLIFDSDAAWDMLARHGSTLASQTELFVALVKTPQETGPERCPRHSVRYFGHCLPFVSAVYLDDTGWLREIVNRHGLPPTERLKLRLLPSESGIATGSTNWQAHLEILASEPGFLAARRFSLMQHDRDHRNS
jgi:hypothetical protein